MQTHNDFNHHRRPYSETNYNKKYIISRRYKIFEANLHTSNEQSKSRNPQKKERYFTVYDILRKN